MTLTKTTKSLIAAVLCAGLLAGCSAAGNSGSDVNSEVSSDVSEVNSDVSAVTSDVSEVTSDVSDSAVNTESADSSAPAEGEDNSTDNTAADITVKIAALKGPTAMGMTKLMADDEADDMGYEFTIAAAVDEISPMVVQGTADIVCVPANLGSVLYNKTEGGVEVLAVNTLGVLYICENGSTVTSVDDLRGKTIYSSGKGATPEYALNYILTQNGIDPEKDVAIEWKSEHSECLSALLEDENGVAMLPQPFVTTAQTKNENINVVLDLTEEWDKLGTGSSLITGIVIGRKEFVESNPAAVDLFLERYADSVEYVTTNVAEGAELVGKYEIVPAAVAQKAIPQCNIVCITGGEMKEKLSGYLGVLFEQMPASVGGALPADDFYYGA
ncbi:MAG: PhnD/SsuA/transferrin family substrate-binding protein [Oscillospiraceae bacterium]